MINRERRGGATPELIPLITARLAVFSESESGAKLNSTRIKNLTGSDKISARQLYGKQITFRPQAKLFMMTNHLPDFDFRDRAMVDRVKLIPFKARFEVTPENTRFVDDLRKEHLSEMFSWIAEGSRLFYESGMGEIPKCCVETLESFVDENDNVARFIAAEFEVVDGTPEDKKKHRLERQYVHFLYTKFCEGEQEDPVAKRVLYKQLSDVFDLCKSHGKRYFVGIRDKEVEVDDGRPGSGGS